MRFAPDSCLKGHITMSCVLEMIKYLARRAGEIQLAHLGKVEHIEYKGEIDPVTEVDRKCERFIVGEIQRLFPGDDILAEEGTGQRSRSSNRWIIDPLDGTVNYAHGFPFFCVSIALEQSGEVVAGAVFDPNRDELFAAEKGRGATLNGQPIHVSATSRLKEALLATGFAYNVQESDQLDNLDNFANFVKTAQAVRRPGAAAIDLAWTACGRIDGFWELFLKPWDKAAGFLLITEAGGTVSLFDGLTFDLYGDELLASNGLIHRDMIRVLAEGRPTAPVVPFSTGNK